LMDYLPVIKAIIAGERIFNAHFAMLL
jgi:hypothetical protein